MTRAASWRGALVGAIALAACTACADTLVGPPPASTNGSLFDQLWKDVDQHYPYFIYKNINWDSLGTVFRPQALAAANDHEFAAVLSDLLDQLHDAHVSLTPTNGMGTLNYISPSANTPTYFSQRTTLAKYVPGAAATSGAHVLYGMLAPGVGYLRIPTFADAGWAAELDEALAGIGGAKAIVLDVRENSGGDRSTAVAVAGRFADSPKTFGFLQFRDGPAHDDFTAKSVETVVPTGSQRFTGPVYVLTNRHVFSSAEELVLAMKVEPQTTVVGDTTGGASGGPVTRELSNGWTYALSQWIEYTPSGTIYEQVGLGPDVLVKATSSDASVGRDAQLERALALAEARIAGG